MTPPPPPDRRAIGVIGAYLEGWRRVLRAPVMWVSLLVLTVVILRPIGNVLGGLLEDSRPGSHLDIQSGITDSGRGWTMDIYAGAVSAGSQMLIGQTNSTVIGIIATYVGLWLFLWGGILDRVARDRPIGTAAFFAACGVHFVRFLRLAVIVGAAYWALFQLLAYVAKPPVSLADFDLRHAGYFVTLAAIVVVGAIEDYAMVRTVVEDRRSMLGAIVASLRFIRRRVFAVFGLSLVNILAVLGVVAIWGFPVPLAPGVRFLLMSTGVLLRLWVRLAFASSEVVLFQHALAHADYTAAPLPVWPDSPAAEAIENLTRVGQMSEGRGQKSE